MGGFFGGALVAFGLLAGVAAAHAQSAEEYYQKGVAALSDGNVVSAMEQFTAALDAAPMYAAAAVERGKLFLRIGEPRLAVADFTTAILSSGELSGAYAWRGEAKAVLKDDAGAIADFDKAVELAPADADALVMRATYFLRKGAIGKAREDLARAKSVAEPVKADMIQKFIDRL